jgi:ABC-type Co2+ transport system permease subunit
LPGLLLHIPDGVLSPSVAAVTSLIGAGAIGGRK